MMTYGDALGFAYENTNSENLKLVPFTLRYNETLKLNQRTGQWSDITELLLIQAKSLRDIKEKNGVYVDYPRFKDELRYWLNYRHGNPNQIINRIEQEEVFTSSQEYWQDKRGYGFSRIVSILLANKNNSISIQEIYKQILFFNRHPQVIITVLLLTRVINQLMESNLTQVELIEELKIYLIALRLQELEEDTVAQLPQQYIIQFEREKIELLMALDRIKDNNIAWLKDKSQDSKGILLLALSYYNSLKEGLQLEILDRQSCKEALAIAYGLYGISLEKLPQDIVSLKDWGFINSMGDYILRIRNYEIDKKPYENTRFLDIVQLQINQQVKHPILNNIKVISRQQQAGFVVVEIESKTGNYTLVREC